MLEEIVVFIKVALFITGFIGLPGFVLTRVLFQKDIYLCEDVGLAFALGSGIFVPYAFISYFLELRLSQAIFLYMLFIFIFLGACLLIPQVRQILLKKTYPVFYDFVFILLILTSALLIRNLSHVSAGFTSDYWYHIAQVRYLVDGSIIKNTFPFLPEEIPQWMYPYNSYYLLLAMISKVTDIDIIKVWPAMRMVLIMVFLSSTLLFFRTLLVSNRKALLAITFFLLAFLYFPMVSGVGGLSTIQNLTYPKVGSLWVFLPIISTLIILFVKKELGYQGVIAALIIAVAFQNWHVVNAMYIMIITAAWLLGFAVTRQTQYCKRLIVFTTIVSALPMALFYFLDYRLIESIKTSLSFNSYYLNPEWYAATPILEEFGKRWYITKSSYFFTFGRDAIQPWMVMGFFALPGSILLYGKNKLIQSYLGGFTILPIFLAYNPFTVQIMVAYGAPFLVRRFLFILPIAYAFALIFSAFFERCISKFEDFNYHRFLRMGTLAIICGFFIYFPFVATEVNVGMFDAKPYTNIFELQDNMKKYIRNGATVLSDKETSQALSGLMWVRIVTSKKHLMVTMAPNHNVRIRDLDIFFLKKTSPPERANIAEKYKADYVVVNRSLIKDINIERFNRVFLNSEYEIWANDSVPGKRTEKQVVH